MDERDREILSSKLLMINQALTELPEALSGLKPREITYLHINVIVNTLIPIIRVDVRPFWAAFNRDWSMELQAVAIELYQSEAIHDLPIGKLKSFPWFCAFMLANIQHNLAGSRSLDAAVAGTTADNIAQLP